MADFNLSRGLAGAAGGLADFVKFNADTARAEALTRLRQKGQRELQRERFSLAGGAANQERIFKAEQRGLASADALAQLERKAELSREAQAAKDTRPSFIRTAEALGIPQEEQAAIFRESKRPRGTEVNITNVPEGFTEPTSTTETNVQKELINLDDQIAQVRSIREGFEPGFQTIGGKWSALKSRFKDKVDPGLLGKEERDNLQRFTQHRARSGRLLAKILHDLSGAAVTPHEAERQKVWLPNPGTKLFDGDSPTEFRSKTDRMLGSLKAARTRNIVRLSMGLSLEDAADQYPLGHSAASDQRSAGQALEAYGSWLQSNQGLTKEQAIERVKSELGIRR